MLRFRNRLFHDLVAGLTWFSGILIYTPLATAHDCKVRIVRPLKDDLGNRWAPGKELPVTIERDTPAGETFCAHGGSCIPRWLNGRLAADLLDCRVGASLGAGDHALIPKSERSRKFSEGR